MRVKSRKMCRRLQPASSRHEHTTVLGQKRQNVDRFTTCVRVRNERLRQWIGYHRKEGTQREEGATVTPRKARKERPSNR